MTTNSSPFFIVGVARSGTTLLRFMLCSHSHIYIPPESDFIPRFFQRDPLGPLDRKRLGRIVRCIFTRYRFVGEWQGDPPNPADLVPVQSTPAAFLDALYGAYAQQNGAGRWGDKTPIYASYIDLIHNIFPQAQFIHIIRDPYDAVISLLEAYKQNEFHVDVYFAARNWVRRIRAARTAGARLGPSRYHEVRYENLVANPEQELRRICDFLKEPFEPVMLEHEQLARSCIEPDSHFFSRVRQPVTTANIGRGRRDLLPADQRLVERIARDLMEELGYVVMERGRMSGPEWFRFARLRVKYEVLQAARRIVQAMGLVPPI